MAQSDTTILSAAGVAAYGHEWQTPLACDLDTEARTVRHWASGARPVPPEIMARIPTILRRRAECRAREAEKLQQMAAALS